MSFEDELAEALRRTGEGFTTDPAALTNGGGERGRRLVARRRTAVAGGSVLALVLIATAGAYSAGLFGGSGAEGAARVAAPAPTPPGNGRLTGTGAVSADQMIGNLKALLPAGRLTETRARGTEDELGPRVGAVYDDGKGPAAISLGLQRVDPFGSQARAQTECEDGNVHPHDDCRTEQLPDGSRLLLHQGYEYPDRRVDTKVWRAVLVTVQGFLVDASEWNAASDKGAPVSRTDPPLTVAQLKNLVTSDTWHAALNDLPAADPEPAPPPESLVLRDRKAVDALEQLMTRLGITVPVVSKGGQGTYGYVVLDDGKGKSLVQINVQSAADHPGFTGNSAFTTESDGTKVKTLAGPGEKNGGVTQWKVDTLRKDGLRVVVSAFNTADQNGPATRPAPALTLGQLRQIALAPEWKLRAPTP
ncbi:MULTISPECIES: hypothetical protein [Streptomyces]|uniref:LigA protein n=1 Tax=Streptomyces spororaveus TaxID=284039 RepID=A0ABQ3TE95_9ACTN|nr:MULTISPECIES: hypothetical protein [Streptomyces]MCM9080945.1 hypothetical protein [Streptomyces spororaveus]MCX5304608.1 hypothetical protein [Streptomyces sp. NBC_00160]GHI78667.1 hypothetical protein Sspor_42280 [Streptomyces spororaveus]